MDYYFSNAGLDTNLGTEASPFQTLAKARSLSLQDGDNLFFNRGDTFLGYLQYSSVSGTVDNNISFKSYGLDYLKKPVITSMEEQVLTWAFDAGLGLWYTDDAHQGFIPRLVRDDVEILRANYVEGTHLTPTEELLNQPVGLVDAFEWVQDSVYLSPTRYRIWIRTDPTGSVFKYSSVDRTFYVINQDYYFVSDIDIQGGLQASLGFYGSIGSTAYSLSLGKHAKQALYYTNSSFCLAKSIHADSVFNFDIEVDALMYKGYSSRGPADGVFIQNNNNNLIISNVFLKDWLHNSLVIYAYEIDKGYDSHNHKVNNCTFTSPNATYGGGMGVVGMVHDCEIYNNLWLDTSVTNQINGFNNHYHHNIMNVINRSLIKGDAIIADAINVGGGSTGDAIGVYGNLYEYNTIIGSDTFGLMFFSTTSSGQKVIKDCIARRNIFVNNGKGNSGLSVSINENNDTIEWQDGNSIVENIIFSRDTILTCRHDSLIAIDVDAFNLSSSASAVIADNLAIDPMLNSDGSLKDGSQAVGYGAMPDNTKSYNIGYTAQHSGKLVHRINGGADSNALAITDTFLDETEFDVLVQSPEYFNNIHDSFLASDISVKALVNMTEGVGETVLDKVSNTQLTLNSFDVTKWDSAVVSKSIQKIKLGSLDGMNFSEPNTTQIISPELVAPYTIIIVADGVHTALVVDELGNATEYNDLIAAAGTAMVGDVVLSNSSPINGVAVTKITVVEIDNRAYTADEIASNRSKYI